MMIVNSITTFAKEAMKLDKKAILLSSPVVTYKLSKVEINKEFDKYSKILKK